MSQNGAHNPGHTIYAEPNTLDSAIQETKRTQSVVADAAMQLGVPANKVCDLLRHVWKTSKGNQPLTDQEMFAGLSLIARYDLDPITKEIYVTRTGDGKLATIIGVDGWIKVLDRTDHYDGFECEIHRDESGNVDWVETKIHSTKRRHPAVYRAYADEYATQAGFVAKKMQTHMLRIFSLRHAARLFTPVGGAMLHEEYEAMCIGNQPAETRPEKTPRERVKEFQSRATSTAAVAKAMDNPSELETADPHDTDDYPEPATQPGHSVLTLDQFTALCNRKNSLGSVEDALEVYLTECPEEWGELAEAIANNRIKELEG